MEGGLCIVRTGLLLDCGLLFQTSRYRSSRLKRALSLKSVRGFYPEIKGFRDFRPKNIRGVAYLPWSR